MTLRDIVVLNRTCMITSTYRRANNYPVVHCGQFINPDSVNTKNKFVSVKSNYKNLKKIG